MAVQQKRRTRPVADSLIHRNTGFGGVVMLAPGKRIKEHLMLDFVMLALGLGMFTVAIGYAYACERL
jgi:hypothetical protein